MFYVCSSLSSNFWLRFNRAVCFPENCGCEELADSIILQPQATISNAFLILLGIYLILNYNTKFSQFTLLGGLTIYSGLSSMIFHSSLTSFGLIMDFSGISMIATWALSVFFLPTKRLLPLILIVHLVQVLLIKIDISFRFIFPGIILISNLSYIFYKKSYLKDKNLICSAVTLFLGLLMFKVDSLKLLCTSLSLHSFWHLFVSISIYFYFLFIIKNNLFKKN